MWITFSRACELRSFGPIIDGVWNLVLACQKCNRGINGNADLIPTLKLLERLHRRSPGLKWSHPLG